MERKWKLPLHRCDDLLLSVPAKILSKNLGFCLFVLQKMAVFVSGTSEALIDELFKTRGYLRKPRMTVLSIRMVLG